MRTEMIEGGAAMRLVPQTMGDGFQLGVVIGSLADSGEIIVGRDYALTVPVNGRLKVDPAAPPAPAEED